MTTVHEAIALVVSAGKALDSAKGTGDSARSKLVQAARTLQEAVESAQLASDMARPRCYLNCFAEDGGIARASVVILRKSKSGALVVRHAGHVAGKTHTFVPVCDQFGKQYVSKDSVVSTIKRRRWLSNIPSEYQSTN